jgi:hypothetical protein
MESLRTPGLADVLTATEKKQTKKIISCVLFFLWGIELISVTLYLQDIPVCYRKYS